MDAVIFRTIILRGKVLNKQLVEKTCWPTSRLIVCIFFPVYMALKLIAISLSVILLGI